MSEENTNEKKQKFTKPEMKKVPLKVEEAVLAACKSDTIKQNGPGGSMNLCQNSAMGVSSPCNTYSS